jgi:hypothetical protein
MHLVIFAAFHHSDLLHDIANMHLYTLTQGLDPTTWSKIHGAWKAVSWTRKLVSEQAIGEARRHMHSQLLRSTRWNGPRRPTNMHRT